MLAFIPSPAWKISIPDYMSHLTLLNMSTDPLQNQQLTVSKCEYIVLSKHTCLLEVLAYGLLVLTRHTPDQCMARKEASATNC